MKVLVSAYACNPTRGGECGNGFQWAYQMARHGHHVWCLTPGHGEEHGKAADIAEFMRQNAHDPATARMRFLYPTVPGWVQFLHRWQFGVYLNYMAWQYCAWRTAQRLERTVHFDLVHHATYSSLKMGSWMWRLRKPMAYGPVGGAQKAPLAFRQYVPDWFKTETLRSAFTWVLTQFDFNLRQNLRHATLVLASNDESADLARRLGAPRVELFLDTGLAEAFQTARFQERAPAPVLRLLWVGRLYPNKALPLVLDALSQVAEQVPFHLTVLGDGPLRHLVPGWIAQYGLEGRVSWAGNVPWAEVHAAMLDHDVFVFGSLRDSFASQFMEAMAAGLPIITLNHQGARTFIPAAASFKVSIESPAVATAAMARAVEYLYHHPAERRAMGRASYDFAMRQTWPRRMERLLEMLREAGVDTGAAAAPPEPPPAGHEALVPAHPHPALAQP